MSDIERLLIEAEVNSKAAEDALAHLQQTIAGVEDAPPPVITPEVDQGPAVSDLGDVKEAADRLDEEHPTVTVEADTTQAARHLGDFTTQAEAQGKGAGSKFGASFIQDVGGVIDQNTAGLASQLAQGLETGLAAAGVAESIAGPLAAAFGIAGVAFIAVKTFWSAFNQGADDAKHAVEGVTSAQEDLAKGQLEAASRKLLDTYKDTYKAASQYGLSVADVTNFLTGQTSATDDWIASAKKQADQLATGTPAQRAQAAAIQGTIDKLNASKGAWDQSSDSIAAANNAVQQVSDSLGNIPRTVPIDVIVKLDANFSADMQRYLAAGGNLRDAIVGVPMNVPSVPTAAPAAAQQTTSAQRAYARTNGATTLWP